MNLAKKEDILKIMNLARISLDENEIKKYTDEISKILVFFDKLSEVNTDGVESLNYGMIANCNMREDKEKKFEKSDALPNCSKIKPVENMFVSKFVL